MLSPHDRAVLNLAVALKAEYFTLRSAAWFEAILPARFRQRRIMPHLIVEYSSNPEEQMDLDGLMTKLRDRPVASGVFPLGGIRVRGERRDRYLVADGASGNGFVHLTARIGHGRNEATRRAAAEALFELSLKPYAIGLRRTGPRPFLRDGRSRPVDQSEKEQSARTAARCGRGS